MFSFRRPLSSAFLLTQKLLLHPGEPPWGNRHGPLWESRAWDFPTWRAQKERHLARSPERWVRGDFHSGTTRLGDLVSYRKKKVMLSGNKSMNLKLVFILGCPKDVYLVVEPYPPEKWWSSSDWIIIPTYPNYWGKWNSCSKPPTRCWLSG